MKRITYILMKLVYSQFVIRENLYFLYRRYLLRYRRFKFLKSHTSNKCFRTFFIGAEIN